MNSPERRVRLSGRLICRNPDEAATVARLLPAHIALTRAEPGCISFAVERSDDPLIWNVEELFSDADTFRAHQARAATSEWGRATRDIARDYGISGLDSMEG